MAPYLDDRSRRVVDAVTTAAEGLGVAPLEVALAWVRDRPGVVAPIVGARTAGQLRGALESEGLELPGRSAVRWTRSRPRAVVPGRGGAGS